MYSRRSTLWTFAISSIALFMVALDNLVVTTALPVIRRDLGASLADLEWMVNAYTLTFAVLLLTGAALGDRFGRRRMFVVGLIIFTAGSAAAALSPSSDILILARAVQGVGGAFVTPLSLTILSAAVPPERRAVALGAWGGVAGLAIAIGPVVGGAIAEGLSWHWIFWLNVPIGIVAAIFAATRLTESHGPDSALDLPGLGLVSAGLLALVWGVIHGNDYGWSDTRIVAALVVGAILMALFVLWESRTKAPMLPLRFFRNRAFSVSNGISFLMYFGVFGAVFLLVQFFQVVQGLSPFQSGLRTLPWTAMPAFVAPIAGVLAGRIGGRPILVTGLALLSAGSVLGRGGGHPDRGICRPRARLRDGRHRDGPVLRPDRQRGPVRRPSDRGGPGVRRQQHHPRDRRRVRGRRPGDRVLVGGLVSSRPPPSSTAFSRRCSSARPSWAWVRSSRWRSLGGRVSPSRPPSRLAAAAPGRPPRRPRRPPADARRGVASGP